ncbi:unnamed protein product [Closterium sp. Yama58-4]|nr:unnamed protein product [Closterium sp. Yama58-4]
MLPPLRRAVHSIPLRAEPAGPRAAERRSTCRGGAIRARLRSLLAIPYEGAGGRHRLASCVCLCVSAVRLVPRSADPEATLESTLEAPSPSCSILDSARPLNSPLPPPPLAHPRPFPPFAPPHPLSQGLWTAEEDAVLMECVQRFREGNWTTIAQRSGLARSGKSCRLRWVKHLSPAIRPGPLTEAEQRQVIELQRRFGNKWALMAQHMPGRSDNAIKNFWNSYRKRMQRRVKAAAAAAKDGGGGGGGVGGGGVGECDGEAGEKEGGAEAEREREQAVQRQRQVSSQQVLGASPMRLPLPRLPPIQAVPVSAQHPMGGAPMRRALSFSTASPLTALPATTPPHFPTMHPHTALTTAAPMSTSAPSAVSLPVPAAPPALTPMPMPMPMPIAKPAPVAVPVPAGAGGSGTAWSNPVGSGMGWGRCGGNPPAPAAAHADGSGRHGVVTSGVPAHPLLVLPHGQTHTVLLHAPSHQHGMEQRQVNLQQQQRQRLTASPLCGSSGYAVQDAVPHERSHLPCNADGNPSRPSDARPYSEGAKSLECANDGGGAGRCKYGAGALGLQGGSMGERRSEGGDMEWQGADGVEAEEGSEEEKREKGEWEEGMKRGEGQEREEGAREGGELQRLWLPPYLDTPQSSSPCGSVNLDAVDAVFQSELLVALAEDGPGAQIAEQQSGTLQHSQQHSGEQHSGEQQQRGSEVDGEGSLSGTLCSPSTAASPAAAPCMGDRTPISKRSSLASHTPLLQRTPGSARRPLFCTSIEEEEGEQVKEKQEHEERGREWECVEADEGDAGGEKGRGGAEDGQQAAQRLAGECLAAGVWACSGDRERDTVSPLHRHLPVAVAVAEAGAVGGGRGTRVEGGRMDEEGRETHGEEKDVSGEGLVDVRGGGEGSGDVCARELETGLLAGVVVGSLPGGLCSPVPLLADTAAAAAAAAVEEGAAEKGEAARVEVMHPAIAPARRTLTPLPALAPPPPALAPAPAAPPSFFPARPHLLWSPARSPLSPLSPTPRCLPPAVFPGMGSVGAADGMDALGRVGGKRPLGGQGSAAAAGCAAGAGGVDVMGRVGGKRPLRAVGRLGGAGGGDDMGGVGGMQRVGSVAGMGGLTGMARLACVDAAGGAAGGVGGVRSSGVAGAVRRGQGMGTVMRRRALRGASAAPQLQEARRVWQAILDSPRGMCAALRECMPPALRQVTADVTTPLFPLPAADAIMPCADVTSPLVLGEMRERGESGGMEGGGASGEVGKGDADGEMVALGDSGGGGGDVGSDGSDAGGSGGGESGGGDSGEACERELVDGMNRLETSQGVEGEQGGEEGEEREEEVEEGEAEVVEAVGDSYDLEREMGDGGQNGAQGGVGGCEVNQDGGVAGRVGECCTQARRMEVGTCEGASGGGGLRQPRSEESMAAEQTARRAGQQQWVVDDGLTAGGSAAKRVRLMHGGECRAREHPVEEEKGSNEEAASVGEECREQGVRVSKGGSSGGRSKARQRRGCRSQRPMTVEIHRPFMHVTRMVGNGRTQAGERSVSMQEAAGGMVRENQQQQQEKEEEPRVHGGSEEGGPDRAGDPALQEGMSEQQHGEKNGQQQQPQRQQQQSPVLYHFHGSSLFTPTQAPLLTPSLTSAFTPSFTPPFSHPPPLTSPHFASLLGSTAQAHGNPTGANASKDGTMGSHGVEHGREDGHGHVQVHAHASGSGSLLAASPRFESGWVWDMKLDALSPAAMASH